MAGGKKKPLAFCSVCKVSGKQVRVSLHYGARSCQACSLFFRRQASKSKKDACISVFGNCMDLLDKDKKTLCKACRFQACIDQGMMPELVDSKKKCTGKVLQERRLIRRRRLKKHFEDSSAELESEGVEEEGLEANFATVLGFFVTIPGKQPRWVDLAHDSMTAVLPHSCLRPYSTTADLARNLGTLLGLEVALDLGNQFSDLVKQDVAPSDAKRMISHTLRRIQEERRRSKSKKMRVGPTTLPQVGGGEEVELNVPRLLPEASYSKRTADKSNARRTGDLVAMNIQEFVAQYDYKNDKFDKMVDDLGEHSDSEVDLRTHSREHVTLYVENESSNLRDSRHRPVAYDGGPPSPPPSSSTSPSLPLSSPLPSMNPSVIKFQSRRYDYPPLDGYSSTVTSEIQFSEF